MVLQPIGFYTSSLAASEWESTKSGMGTPLPANMLNSNLYRTDKYVFMTLKSLRMTVMDCYQRIISHNHKILSMNKKTTTANSSLKNALSLISNFISTSINRSDFCKVNSVVIIRCQDKQIRSILFASSKITFTLLKLLSGLYNLYSEQNPLSLDPRLERENKLAVLRKKDGRNLRRSRRRRIPLLGQTVR